LIEGHISLGIPAAANRRFLIRYSIELADEDAPDQCRQPGRK